MEGEEWSYLIKAVPSLELATHWAKVTACFVKWASGANFGAKERLEFCTIQTLKA